MIVNLVRLLVIMIALVNTSDDNRINSNSITSNIIHSNNNNDNNNDDNRSSSVNIFRIGTSTLSDVIDSDKSLVLFLNLLGLYYYDSSYSNVFRIISRLWSWLLEVVLICIIISLVILDFITIKSDDLLHIKVSLLYISILLQYCGIIYAIRNIRGQLQQSVNSVTNKQILAHCKRDAIVFLGFLSIFIIINNVLYAAADKNAFRVIYDIPLTFLLTVVMIFTSLSLLQVQDIQQALILAINSKQGITTSQYLAEKEKIMCIQRESYWSHQVVTITAAINIILFLATVVLLYIYINKQYSHIDDIVWTDVSIDAVAFLFRCLALYSREIVFLYYILFKVATINSNNDKLKGALVRKCWEIENNSINNDDGISNNNSDSSNNKCINSYMLMYQDASTFPTVFKLGTLEVSSLSLI